MKYIQYRGQLTDGIFATGAYGVPSKSQNPTFGETRSTVNVSDHQFRTLIVFRGRGQK